MKKVFRPSLVIFSALFVTSTLSAHKSHRSHKFHYDYYRHGKVAFQEGQCRSLAYDKKVRPQRKHRTEATCLALNPAQESSQNRYIDPNGDLQTQARFLADETLNFERRHDLPSSEADTYEASLSQFSERLYIGESALLKYKEIKFVLQKRIDRLMSSRRGYYYRYYQVAWYKRYIKFIDRKKAYVENTYKPYVLSNVQDLQTKLGKDAVVEAPTFDYSNVEDATSFGLITLSQQEDIFAKSDRIDAALALMDDKGFTCDDAVLAISDGQPDQTYSSLSSAIQSASSATTILVGSSVAREDISISTSTPLTIVSRCDAEINTLTMTITEDLVIDGFVFENRTNNNQATVSITLITSDVLFVNNTVRQSGVDGDGILIDADESEIWILGNDIAGHSGNGIVISNPITTDNILIANNLISDNGDNGVLISSDRDIALLRNDIENNGSYGLTRDGSGSAARIQIIENNILNNAGVASAGISTIDVGQYSNLLDAATDFGNITTTGGEEEGVEAL